MKTQSLWSLRGVFKTPSSGGAAPAETMEELEKRLAALEKAMEDDAGGCGTLGVGSGPGPGGVVGQKEKWERRAEKTTKVS